MPGNVRQDALQARHEHVRGYVVLAVPEQLQRPRDPVAARYWAERALENPVKESDRGGLQVFLGLLLAESDKPEERVRGLEILERYAQPGYYQYGAKTALAKAIRKQDPVRARKLLEEARSLLGGEVGVCLELGRIYNIIHRPADAVKVLLQALEKNNDNYVILRDLGITYKAMGEKEKALDSLRRSLELNPTQTQIKTLCTQLERQLGG